MSAAVGARLSPPITYRERSTHEVKRLGRLGQTARSAYDLLTLSKVERHRIHHTSFNGYGLGKYDLNFSASHGLRPQATSLPWAIGLHWLTSPNATKKKATGSAER
jgi:hypothetical protein